MLVIHESCKEHYDRVVKWATENGRMADLQEKLDYLGKYACPDLASDHTICILYKDGWDTPDFSFTMLLKRDPDKTYGERVRVDNVDYPNHRYWFNGGLLFHGPHDGFGSGSGPTFAVTLNPTDGWSIHT